MYRIPTIEELMRKPSSELRAIFQKATLASAVNTGSAEERVAASLTLIRIAICQKIFGPWKP